MDVGGCRPVYGNLRSMGIRSKARVWKCRVWREPEDAESGQSKFGVAHRLAD